MEFKIQSDSISKLNESLIKARKDFIPLTFNKKNNRYSYADLSAIFESILSPLRENGLDLKQPIIDIEEKRYLYTRLDHAESGEFIQTRIEINKPKECQIYCSSNGNLLQGYGSQVTYLKRYSLASLLCLSADEDTDANEQEYQQTQKAVENKIDDQKASTIRALLNELPIEIEKEFFLKLKINKIKDIKNEYYESCVDWLKKKANNK